MIHPEEIARSLNEDARQVLLALPDAWVEAELLSTDGDLLDSLLLWVPDQGRTVDAVPLLIVRVDERTGISSYRLSPAGEDVRDALRAGDEVQR